MRLNIYYECVSVKHLCYKEIYLINSYEKLQPKPTLQDLLQHVVWELLLSVCWPSQAVFGF